MRKLIVIADDFGLTRGINKGIARGFRLEIVTSASAMVNMPCWDHAAEIAKRLPGLGVGLHFNLTLGCPVAPPRSVPTLVDAQGRFFGAGSSPFPNCRPAAESATQEKCPLWTEKK